MCVCVCLFIYLFSLCLSLCILTYQDTRIVQKNNEKPDNISEFNKIEQCSQRRIWGINVEGLIGWEQRSMLEREIKQVF